MHCRLFPQAGNKWASIIADQLLTFAVAVREGQYGLRAQVKVQSVERALRHVAQMLVLDGHPDPRRASPAQQSLDFPISRLIKKYRNEDPPAEPKLAIPISTITAIATNYRWDTHLDAAADLVIITFFYLLRVGEYTTSAKKKPKCTIALQDQDVRLWRKGQLIPHSAGLDLLLTADSATICNAPRMVPRGQWSIMRRSEAQFVRWRRWHGALPTCKAGLHWVLSVLFTMRQVESHKYRTGALVLPFAGGPRPTASSPKVIHCNASHHTA
jgi:hypothetical protein